MSEVLLPTCPICGNELIYNEMIGSYTEATMLFQDWIGECKHCKKKYRWTERYEYLRYFDLKESPE